MKIILISIEDYTKLVELFGPNAEYIGIEKDGKTYWDPISHNKIPDLFFTYNKACSDESTSSSTA